jgi:hypothetical protein
MEDERVTFEMAEVINIPYLRDHHPVKCPVCGYITRNLKIHCEIIADSDHRVLEILES